MQLFRLNKYKRTILIENVVFLRSKAVKKYYIYKSVRLPDTTHIMLHEPNRHDCVGGANSSHLQTEKHVVNGNI